MVKPLAQWLRLPYAGRLHGIDYAHGLVSVHENPGAARRLKQSHKLARLPKIAPFGPVATLWPVLLFSLQAFGVRFRAT
jgi:hypothetical protein